MHAGKPAKDGADQPSNACRAGRANGRNREHGIAVLMVVVCLAVLLPFTASFNYNARVDWQSAVNQGDEIKARNLQRGAMRLSVLLFELQRLVFNQTLFQQYVGKMDITQVAPYLMSVFGSQDGGEGLGALLGLNTESLNELAVADGGFEVRLEAESGRVNVNCLGQTQGGKNRAQERTIEVLEALMMPTLYDPLFDEEKADGRRYTREQVIAGIVDYIDDDRRKFDVVRLRARSNPEDYRYDELHDRYQARNARLDSVDELHLVEGIDDDWMAAFAAELTVYGSCKVNLNFASADQIALVIRHSANEEGRDLVSGENFLLKTLPLAKFVVESREFSLFKKTEDFKQLVEQPDQFVNPLALMMGQQEQDDSLLPQIPQGIPIRLSGSKDEDDVMQGGVNDIANVDPERVYRVDITTEVGSVRKRVIGVYDMQYARSQSQGKGAWLYYREE
ncbi:MAG: general secretion pathway protein GspK [Myxococcales bacterium FL481]|nr:MAG: general secretion pathway protein GspK [Myxococcales bacterium FL481]